MPHPDQSFSPFNASQVSRPITPEEEEELRALMKLERDGPGSSMAGQPWHVDEPIRHGPPMRPKLEYTPAQPAPPAGASPAVPPDLDWSNAAPNPKEKVPGVDGPGPRMTDMERGLAEIGENHNLDSLHELDEWNKAISAGRPVEDKPRPNPPLLPRRVSSSSADVVDQNGEEAPASDAKSAEDGKAARSVPSISSKPPSRKELILGSLQGDVKVNANPAAKSDAPGHEVTTLGIGAVAHYDEDIAYAARIKGIDPDLIRAVMHMEMSHGWYDPSGLGVPYSLLPTSKSILPMNVNANYWGDAFGSKAELSMGRINVVSGTEMLRRIQKIAPGAGIAEIATLYNNVNADKVSDYGARVAQIYKDKPWESLTKPALKEAEAGEKK